MINYTQHSDSRGKNNNTDINIKASNILPFLLTLKSGFNKKDKLSGHFICIRRFQKCTHHFWSSDCSCFDTVLYWPNRRLSKEAALCKHVTKNHQAGYGLTLIIVRTNYLEAKFSFHSQKYSFYVRCLYVITLGLSENICQPIRCARY